MDHFLNTLSIFSESLKFEQLRKETVHQAKRRIIDTLGCAMGAYHTEPPRIARHYAMQTTADPGATFVRSDQIDCSLVQ